MAVNVLFIRDMAKWKSQLPLELQHVADVFNEMKDVFYTGSFKITSSSAFHKFVQRTQWTRAPLSPVNEERFMTGLMQIAHVLAELPKASSNNSSSEVNRYDLSQAKWRYTPLRVLTASEVKRMSAHAMRTSVPALSWGVLIEACNASCMREMMVSLFSVRVKS